MPETVVLGWEFWGALCALLTFWSAALLWAVRWVVAAQSEKLDYIQAEVKPVETGFQELRVELAQHYVRREDWIRFSAVIDAKQDALRESTSAVSAKLDTLALQINQLEKARESRHPS